MKKYTTANVFEHPLNENNEFQEALQDFINMRKKIRKPVTDRAVKLLILKLIDLSEENPEQAVKIIDQSLVNNWLDFYQLKEEQNAGYNAGNQKKLKDI